jgi:hypothetical protein
MVGIVENRLFPCFFVRRSAVPCPVSVKEQVRVVAELLDPEEVGRVETRESVGICKKIFQRSSFFECTGY